MSNPLVGEGEFRGIKLRMDYGRFCALEAATGLKMPQLCTDFEMGLGLSDLRIWFKCFSEGDVTFADIDAAIHQGGMMEDYAAATGAIGALLRGFFNPPRAKSARPPKAG